MPEWAMPHGWVDAWRGEFWGLWLFRSGLTRAIPGARPCGRRAAVQNGYPAILSNQGSNPISHHHLKQESPILRQGSLVLDGGEGGIMR